MAQLFNRLRDYLKAELRSDAHDSIGVSAPYDGSNLLDASDAELRDAIDALSASPLAQAAVVLGVSPGCTLAEAHAAWRRGVAMVHPDKFAAADAATRSAANERLHALNNAYRVFQHHHEHQP
jgi:DnaJ-domain-containing protein 1